MHMIYKQNPHRDINILGYIQFIVNSLQTLNFFPVPQTTSSIKNTIQFQLKKKKKKNLGSLLTDVFVYS